jgi:hypothetical protein
VGLLPLKHLLDTGVKDDYNAEDVDVDIFALELSLYSTESFMDSSFWTQRIPQNKIFDYRGGSHLQSLDLKS